METVSKAVDPSESSHLMNLGQSEWNSKFHCFDNLHCTRDLPLCLYATCCPAFAFAETMEILGTPAFLCPSPSALNNLVCIGSVSAIDATFSPTWQWISFPVAFLQAFIFRDTRRALGSQYNVPMDSCHSPYLAHLFCHPCAAYQEMVYVKHALKKDFSCVCYHVCQKVFKSPQPGYYQDQILPDKVVSAQPGSSS